MVSKEGVTGAHPEGWLPAPLVVICEVTLDGKLPELGSVGQTGRSNLCLNLTAYGWVRERVNSRTGARLIG